MLVAEGEELAGQRGGPMGGGEDQLELLAQLVAPAQPVDHELAAPGDDGQEIVEVVGHPAREPAHRLHLLRLAQLFLHPVLAGHVPHHAHVVGHVAGRVGDGEDGPHLLVLRAVLPHVHEGARPALASREGRPQGLVEFPGVLTALEHARIPAEQL